MMAAGNALPLQGIRVVDLSRLVAGNMLSLQLADFGADVVKVESRSGGDTLRQWTERVEGSAQGFDAWWQVYGRNKRSIAMDLRDAGALAALRKLLDTAQILVESFRPGTLEAMGLAPETLHRSNPKLVVVRVSGWGQDGPYRELPGFGSLIEGFSGFAARHGTPEGLPMLPNMALADMVAGLTGAFATLAALRAVEVGGGAGQVIDLSLLEPMLAIMGPDAAAFAATGAKPDARAKIASPRGVYRCRDGGWVALSGSTDAMARRVLEAIGQGALADDPRFRTNAARLAHDAEIDAMLQTFIGTLGRGECLALFRAKGVTVGPVQDIEQLLQDPHVQARGAYLRMEVPGRAEPVVAHGVTPRLSATPGQLRRPAPRLGEHTAELLAELGLGEAAIVALEQSGGVACSSQD